MVNNIRRLLDDVYGIYAMVAAVLERQPRSVDAGEEDVRPD